MESVTIVFSILWISYKSNLRVIGHPCNGGSPTSHRPLLLLSWNLYPEIVALVIPTLGIGNVFAPAVDPPTVRK